MKLEIIFDDDGEVAGGKYSPTRSFRSYAVSDEILDDFLADLRRRGKLEELKTLYEDSPRSQMLLLLMVSHLENGGDTDGCWEAAEKRLDAALEKAENTNEAT